MRFEILSFLFFFLLKNHVASKRYTNYTLFRSVPLNSIQLDFLRTMGKAYRVNYWREPGVINKTVEFTVAPEDKEVLLKAAEQNNVDVTTIMEDVQQAFDKQTVATYIRRRLSTFDWQNYYRLRDIYVWLKDLAAAHPEEVVIQSIGKTFEGRHILACKVNLKGTRKRSTVIVEGGIHAREWVGAAFVTFFIHQIVNSPSSKNLALKMIGSTYEFVFIPVTNPDGYEYTHTTDRLWRKNRVNRHGVDINRNFGIAFGTVGVSFDKDDEIYCGHSAFSEKESQAMAKIINSYSSTLEYYLAFHSYGQYMILPYAHSQKHQENFDEVARICQTANNKIKHRYGTIYTVGTAYDTVGYSTSGVSGCWTKASFRTPYVITFELRDSGRHGFALPPSQIMPTCLETMDGVVSILNPKGKKLSKIQSSYGESVVTGTASAFIVNNTSIRMFNGIVIITLLKMHF
ncbi:zinc carboxypeptidase-like [Hyposmocoma kahamanoa]|uniref:zinc carboxypeptidase-like n=1 Tax=Hyposmocoma kahamanoa TaxID=1477025 RepID=UPI000E6D5E1B|nr:zinc carboxypeptidase-like [Hyposmocoma kahamanoa]